MNGREVWITGIGLVSSLGEGVDAHWERLSAARPAPVVDEASFAPYPVHPLAPVNFSRFVPKRSDQNQMGAWQLTGVLAAGLALEDAGIAGNAALLDACDLVIAAGNGERDVAADRKVLDGMAGHTDILRYLNETLPRALRPTLYLAELSNLLAGNISIIHGVTGSSRTFKGEEIAGVSAVEDAFRRVQSGQNELFLVGSAYNAQREDQLLIFELDQHLWHCAYKPVWERSGAGGMALGSLGAFLIIEARAHAEARGAKAYARIADVATGRCERNAGETTSSLNTLFARLNYRTAGHLPVLSGACGAHPATSEELAFLHALDTGAIVRAYGTILGHSTEAHFPAGVALAALAISRGAFYPPFDASGIETDAGTAPETVLVTCTGHWRGEGLALVTHAN
jgi:3-oxoacyl-[acyl-carrier-protein] synthase II